LERIVRSSSRPGGLVMDLFVGSGTTADAAVKNGRRFLAADVNPLSMQLVRRRTDGAATLYAHEPFDGAPEIRARAESGIGFTAVRLEGFSSDDPTLPEGMDAVDCWAAGYERDGVFYSYAEEARSREKPAPAFELAVPMYEGRLMLRVTDVKGRDYCGYVESSALS
ncbi:MAG: DNA methyltransferase, partial [Clostridia bacterium]|nr:DNA methyltransferase [Clostridia bacterium]